jgi:hypothetical protein
LHVNNAGGGRGSMEKILILADVHGCADKARHAMSENPDASLVLIAGDVTNFGNAESVMEVLSEIQGAISRLIPIFAVPGNCDPLVARRAIEKSGCNVEDRVINLPYCTLTGSGGGLRRAGITSYERTEEELGTKLSTTLQQLSKNRKDAKPIIVISHAPPYGTNADRHGKLHVGSTSFSEIMQKTTPQVWICGHIHESRCVSTEDGCLVINPGPCSYGYYAILEIEADSNNIYTVHASLSR